jgi:hypothetical protein
VLDKVNKLINGAIVNLGDLVSIKCYVRYWRHFVSKQHGIALKLVVVKKLIKVLLLLIVIIFTYL